MSGSPFNTCDYLCEKCLETQHCKVYALLEKKALSKQLNGAMKDRPGASLQDVKESLDETIELLKRLAEDLSIEFDDVAQDMEELDQHYVDNDELYQLSLTFTLKAHAFLKKIEPLIESDLTDVFEDVVWYHTMVSVKTHRAVASDYDGLSEDAVNSAEVAMKSLAKCVEAFELIKRRCTPASDEARSLSNTAIEIQRQIRKRFPPNCYASRHQKP
jgi:hypothetical protein